jgi:hypothetical protein
MNRRDFSVAIHEATNAEWPPAVRAGHSTSGYVGVAERDGLEPGRFPSRREHDLPSSPSAETGAFVVLDAPLLKEDSSEARANREAVSVVWPARSSPSIACRSHSVRALSRGFATCARERLRFAKLSIGRAAQGRARRSNFAPFWPHWTVAGRSRRQYAGPRPSCVGISPGVHSPPLSMSRGATPSHHSVVVCNERFTSQAAVPRKLWSLADSLANGPIRTPCCRSWSAPVGKNAPEGPFLKQGANPSVRLRNLVGYDRQGGPIKPTRGCSSRGRTRGYGRSFGRNGQPWHSLG